MPETEPSSPPETSGRWLAWGLVAITGLLFWPVTRWIVAETVAREQIKQGMLLLVAAAALIIWKHRHDLHIAAEIDNRALGLLAMAFACVGVAGVNGWPLMMMPGLTLGMAGSLQIIFGANGYRFLKPLVAGVAMLVVIILIFPMLDWPLRQLAGVEATRVLGALGLAPQLAVANAAQNPQLMLKVGPQVFLVATECNGFGIITSGALLALLAGEISKRSRWLIAALMLLALFTGFVVNLLRILAITQLAPHMPRHYHAMHEIVGTVMLWAGLGLIGWLAWRPQASVLPKTPTTANF